jgi:hypothetical protein
MNPTKNIVSLAAVAEEARVSGGQPNRTLRIDFLDENYQVHHAIHHYGPLRFIAEVNFG